MKKNYFWGAIILSLVFAACATAPSGETRFEGRWVVDEVIETTGILGAPTGGFMLFERNQITKRLIWEGARTIEDRIVTNHRFTYTNTEIVIRRQRSPDIVINYTFDGAGRLITQMSGERIAWVREGAAGAAQAAPQVTRDWWTDRVTWADGSHTNFVLAYNWVDLEEYLRNNESVNIDISGVQWDRMEPPPLLSDMMRRNISAAPNNRVTGMAVFVNENNVVVRIDIIHAERQSDGIIQFWDAGLTRN